MVDPSERMDAYSHLAQWKKEKRASKDAFFSGGEGGIRTLGGPEPTTVFETVPFNHSGTSPSRFQICECRMPIEFANPGAARL